MQDFPLPDAPRCLCGCPPILHQWHDGHCFWAQVLCPDCDARSAHVPGAEPPEEIALDDWARRVSGADIVPKDGGLAG